MGIVLPHPGDEVEVEVQYKPTSMFETGICVYKGIVLRSEYWDPHGTFRMTGSGQEVPVRIIAMSRVRKLNGTNQTQEATEANQGLTIVRVTGSKGAEYVVTINPHGVNTCTCQGYGFRKRCSHIDGVLKDREGQG